MTWRRPNHVTDRMSFGETFSFFSMTLTVLLTGTTLAMEFRYHNHRLVGKTLTNMTKHFPNIAKRYSLGQSNKGKELWVLVIGKHAAQHTALVPNVKYIANMHGNEVVGREMLLHLAEHLLNNYGRNETLTQFLDTTRVHLMPTMNPDGFALSIKGDCSSTYGRGNAYGYDLNRNFPDPFATSASPEQRETSLVRKWVHSIPFVLSANLHGGALVVNYPYDSLKGERPKPVYAATPDDDVFRHLALTFSRSHHTMHFGNSCSAHFEDGITNGANWYSVIGGMQDYTYRNASGYEVLIEMSCCKYPHVSTLTRMWEVNRDALINYLMLVHMGVKGIIYHQDSSQWLPLEGATFYIQGRQEAAFTSSAWGEYYKLLLPNNYTLQVTYPGYGSQAIPFTVTDSHVTRLDVYMTRDIAQPTPANFPPDDFLSVTEKTTDTSLKSTYKNKTETFYTPLPPMVDELDKKITQGTLTQNVTDTNLKSTYKNKPDTFHTPLPPMVDELDKEITQGTLTQNVTDTSLKSTYKNKTDTFHTPLPPMVDELDKEITQGTLTQNVTDTSLKSTYKNKTDTFHTPLPPMVDELDKEITQGTLTQNVTDTSLKSTYKNKTDTFHTPLPPMVDELDKKITQDTLTQNVTDTNLKSTYTKTDTFHTPLHPMVNTLDKEITQDTLTQSVTDTSLKSTYTKTDTFHTPLPPMMDKLDKEITQDTLTQNVTDMGSKNSYQSWPGLRLGNSSDNETFDDQDFNLSEMTPKAQEHDAAISEPSLSLACISYGHWGVYWGLGILSLCYDQTQFPRWSRTI